jgi:hypothetical protein
MWVRGGPSAWLHDVATFDTIRGSIFCEAVGE